MKLSNARIKGFRSIDDVTLERCGALNVIIGKNNAGKSNLLLALNAFFDCIGDGEPVSIQPPIGRVFDYHGNTPTAAIDLSLTFTLTEDEGRQVREAVEEAAPQMRNALEGLDGTLALSVALTIPTDTPSYGFVREIKLVNTGVQPPTEHLMLRVPAAAAAELAESARVVRSRGENAESVRRILDSVRQFGAERWDHMRGDFTSYAMYRREGPAAPEAVAHLNEMARKSDSYEAFTSTAVKYAESLDTEAAAMRLRPLRTNVETFTGNEDRIPSYARAILSLVAAMPVLYLTERREPIGRREAALLLDLKVSRGGYDQLRRIQQTVTALLGVEIDAFRSETSARRAEGAAELDVDRFVVQVNGAGIREALRLVLDYEIKQPTLLLVEEPEIHLHPALETTVLRYLKSIGSRCQIFVTTHSTNFLDTAEMKNIYLASRNGGTKVQQIGADEAEAIIPRELGLRLSSLFMFDRLVFVEGPTDEEILREFAATLDVNLGRASVGFISLGGVRNFAHYANQQTLAFLTKRRVAMWFVLDRDERDDDDVQGLQRQLGDSAELVALERREIENYLLSPRAIASYISERIESETGTQRDTSAEQVARDLDECADELKELALRYRVTKLMCKPIYPDRRSVLQDEGGGVVQQVVEELRKVCNEVQAREARAAEVADRERAILEERWSRAKLSLTPGDHLLDRVFARYGLRFCKERDSVRLAGVLKAEEIDRRIVDLLGSIAGD